MAPNKLEYSTKSLKVNCEEGGIICLRDVRNEM